MLRKVLLAPADIEPSTPGWQVVGVFNPAAFRAPNGRVMLMVRVAERAQEEREGCVSLVEWDCRRGPYVRWEPLAEWDTSDPRVLRNRRHGCVRLSSVSHLRIFDFGDGLTKGAELGRLVPEEPWEVFGIEDPRVTQIGEDYYLTYAAVSPWGVVTAWAVSQDGVHWQRRGILFPPDNKDVVFFPRRWDTRYVALHRPTPSAQWSRPGIWIASSPDGEHWGSHRLLYEGGGGTWETDRVGAGPPPVAIAQGWLVIYHGSERIPGQRVGKYAAGALLLDADDPCRLLARSALPLWEPQEPFECQGFTPNVVFPTGCIPFADELYIYYGAADMYTAVVQLSWSSIDRAVCGAVKVPTDPSN